MQNNHITSTIDSIDA